MKGSKFWEEVEADFSRETGKKSPAEWKAVIESRLWKAALFEDYRELQRCGRKADYFCRCCGVGKTIELRCNSRLCPECSRIRAARLQNIYVPTIAAVKWPLFVTFTIGGGSRWELAAQLMAVRDGVKKIRRQRWFKNCVTGGVGSFELKWSARGWHVHWHAVLDAKWLAVTVEPWHPGQSKMVLKSKLKAAQKEVADQWAMAVGYDPSFVFIRRAKPETAQYVVKYSVKPADFADETMPIRELVEGMRGAKLVAPWGTVRRIRSSILKAKRLAKEKPPCECGTYSIVWPSGQKVEKPNGRWMMVPMS